MGERDITQKTLESYNDVFADIINVLVFDRCADFFAVQRFRKCFAQSRARCGEKVDER